MTIHNHVAVWLDHKEAHIFHIYGGGSDEATIKAPLQNTHHKHPKGPSGAKEHPDDAKRFFHEIARAMESAEEILVVGPSTAKLELVRYIHKNHHALEPKIIGLETVDHPTDPQIVAYARNYFKKVIR